MNVTCYTPTHKTQVRETRTLDVRARTIAAVNRQNHRSFTVYGDTAGAQGITIFDPNHNTIAVMQWQATDPDAASKQAHATIMAKHYVGITPEEAETQTV